jgi:hypothetical protein
MPEGSVIPKPVHCALIGKKGGNTNAVSSAQTAKSVPGFKGGRGDTKTVLVSDSSHDPIPEVYVSVCNPVPATVGSKTPPTGSTIPVPVHTPPIGLYPINNNCASSTHKESLGPASTIGGVTTPISSVSELVQPLLSVKG